MASISTKQNNQYTYGSYLRELTPCDVAGRAATVVSFSIVGAGTGALIGGASTAGLGVLPCAGIGAGAGAIVGIAVAAAHDVCHYKKFKKELTNEARQNLEKCIQQNGKFDQDDICPITLAVPSDPVKISGEKQVYEREALNEIFARVKEYNSTRKVEHHIVPVSPLTKKPFTKEDIKQDHVHVAKTAAFCDSIINDPDKRNNLTSTELKGIVLLRNQSLKKATQFCQATKRSHINLLKKNKLSLEEYARQAMDLSNLFNSILGHLPESVRFKISPKSIKIDPCDLKEFESKEEVA